MLRLNRKSQPLACFAALAIASICVADLMISESIPSADALAIEHLPRKLPTSAKWLRLDKVDDEEVVCTLLARQGIHLSPAAKAAKLPGYSAVVLRNERVGVVKLDVTVFVAVGPKAGDVYEVRLTWVPTGWKVDGVTLLTQI